MHVQSTENRHIYSVSKLNRLVKTILEGEVGIVWLTAEISNFTAASSGHWYFTLKDVKAQIRSAMFKGANRRLNFRPKEGDKVLVRGTLSLYEARGDYQLICEHMELDGNGALQAAFEQLKHNLNAKGLFATELKRPLPQNINTVGVVTSSTGAALHDILTVLQRRSPTTEVIIYPAQVQGTQAHEQIIRAIKMANSRNEVDVLIVGRGGGSIEDLWCFNNEALAYAIRESHIPVVSAVGHEVDTTIADYVADVRAPTPSAAAELVSKDSQHLLTRLDHLYRSLRQQYRATLEQARYTLTMLEQRLDAMHPRSRLYHQSQRLDELSFRLERSIRLSLRKSSSNLEQVRKRLRPEKVIQAVSNHSLSLKRLERLLSQHMNRLIESKVKQLDNAGQLLQSVSPLATLSRGYSVTMKEDAIITSVSSLKEGDIIVNRLQDGELTSQITKLINKKNW